jgi:hypothetical protein
VAIQSGRLAGPSHQTPSISHRSLPVAWAGPVDGAAMVRRSGHAPPGVDGSTCPSSLREPALRPWAPTLAMSTKEGTAIMPIRHASPARARENTSPTQRESMVERQVGSVSVCQPNTAAQQHRTQTSPLVVVLAAARRCLSDCGARLSTVSRHQLGQSDVTDIRTRALSARAGPPARDVGPGRGRTGWLGAGPGGRADAGLDTGTHTDPHRHPTAQVSGPVRRTWPAATDPCLGVSGGGGDAYGGT